MIPSDLTENERVYFIPYTTDIPKIREGQIASDTKGKFIIYKGGFCDDGIWYLCRVKDINNTQVIHRLNVILSEVSK